MVLNPGGLLASSKQIRKWIWECLTAESIIGNLPAGHFSDTAPRHAKQYQVSFNDSFYLCLFYDVVYMKNCFSLNTFLNTTGTTVLLETNWYYSGSTGNSAEILLYISACELHSDKVSHLYLPYTT